MGAGLLFFCRKTPQPTIFLLDGTLPATLKKIKANKYLDISFAEDNTKLVVYRKTVMTLLEYYWNFELILLQVYNNRKPNLDSVLLKLLRTLTVFPVLTLINIGFISLA